MPGGSGKTGLAVRTVRAWVDAGGLVMAEQTPKDQAPGDRSRLDRARRRAIRAHAAQAGVAYSVAARQLADAGIGPGESLASYGRTVYPVDVAGRWTLIGRELRAPAERLGDARLAARLPGGRARHLAERFPPGEGRAGDFYAGEGREDLLAMLYLIVFQEAPGLVPPLIDLAWTAELGEETAVDTVCAELDRAARQLLDAGSAPRWQQVEEALLAGQQHADGAVRYDADRLSVTWRSLMTPGEDAAGEPYVVRAPWHGVRQVLDALLVVAEDGHAPGTRIRLAQPHEGAPDARREGTIVGVSWGPSGPPTGYEVRLDDDPSLRAVRPDELVVLPNQESGAAVLAH
jgi:hypothetical protein